MSRVTLPATAFEQGDLVPMVCVETGNRAEHRARTVVHRSPSWVWFLLIVPIVFIPVYVFSVERVVGSLPVSAAVHRRIRSARLGRVALWVTAAVIGLVDLIAGLVPGPGLVYSLVLVAGGYVVGRRGRPAVRARLDPIDDTVHLSGVAPTFAGAVDQLQPFLR